jgi:hypothetical protein
MPSIGNDWEVVWDDTIMSRDFAPPGAKKPAYYQIVIPLRRKNKNNSGDHETVPSIKFDYRDEHEEPSWESSSALYKLNQ